MDRSFQRRRGIARLRALPWVPPLGPRRVFYQLDLFEQQDVFEKEFSKWLDNPRGKALRVFDDSSDKLLKRVKQRHWRSLRAQVYWRDGGRCMVCGESTGENGEYYECGHIIDRVVGGPDDINNLVVMCGPCNRLKPLTETREQYLAWARKGGPIFEIWMDAIEQEKGSR